MEHSDFRLGCEFRTETGRWRCTDIGTRTIVAIRIDPVEVTTFVKGSQEIQSRLSQSEAQLEGWSNGPPYAVAEHVFDEYNMEACEPV